MPGITQQIVKHGIIDGINEYLAGTHKNGTAKDWGKAYLGFSQLILQEKRSINEVGGE